MIGESGRGGGQGHFWLSLARAEGVVSVVTAALESTKIGAKNDLRG